MTVRRTAALRLGTLETAIGSALVLCGTVYGCSGGSGGSALQGSERQQCYPNGTCNAGLTCLSNVYVNTGTGDDAAAADAAPADAPGSPADGTGSADARGDTQAEAAADATSDVTSGERFIGNHSIVLDGYSDGRFTFANSYGKDWGDEGRGRLPYEYVDRFLVDAFAHELQSNPRAGRDLSWIATGPLGVPLAGIELWDKERDEREAWAYAVARDGFVDVEELFVRPKYRRRGLGTFLVTELQKVAIEAELPLRAWISWADAGRANMPGVPAVMRRLGLLVGPSPFSWARFVAMPVGYKSLVHL